MSVQFVVHSTEAQARGDHVLSMTSSFPDWSPPGGTEALSFGYYQKISIYLCHFVTFLLFNIIRNLNYK